MSLTLKESAKLSVNVIVFNPVVLPPKIISSPTAGSATLTLSQFTSPALVISPPERFRLVIVRVPIDKGAKVPVITSPVLVVFDNKVNPNSSLSHPINPVCAVPLK